jgi:hypothetical protein
MIHHAGTDEPVCDMTENDERNSYCARNIDPQNSLTDRTQSEFPSFGMLAKEEG